jgi:hypothetical protein
MLEAHRSSAFNQPLGGVKGLRPFPLIVPKTLHHPEAPTAPQVVPVQRQHGRSAMCSIRSARRWAGTIEVGAGSGGGP